MSLLATLPRRALSRPSALATRGITLDAILHGSPEAKAEGEVAILQHSRLVARGKYVHELLTHRVKPEAVDEYRTHIGKYLTGIASNPEFHVKLSGSWEKIVGEQDTFVHILEYENYAGHDKSTKLIRGSALHKHFKENVLPHVRSRTSQICQEFAFLPTSPPLTKGGIYEMRSYQLRPGTLLEWEHTWRRGLDARKHFVKPVGAWFSQVGRLHQVYHIWQYADLNARKEAREQAWQLEGWSATVNQTAKLATSMDSEILIPLPFSPLK
ncbi:NIPSNAP-domain-containing protein [Dacryopinax primogenitus]|uniref:NIPSNAP-domain-containing protein n=1 Tax=Dacryopinax primogenitus (strain DJM 731) TaxID=1858805 RepID=M5G9S6_DACPD|nr:NIPSNAP-domain-containing protein [Dacryopinax primogenitus]EJU02627.1 NIPSNAP-domain-containing protein [Dacryopinax primogenitus]